MEVGLSNVQSYRFSSHETPCFRAVLMIDGKDAAIVSNDGNGGANVYHFKDSAVGLAFKSYCASLPPLKVNGDFLSMSDDLFVAYLLDGYEHSRRIAELCNSGKTVFRLVGDEGKGVRYLDMEWSPESKKKVLERFPNAEFMNEALE